MVTRSGRSISDTLVVPAPPEVVWDILVRPARHAEIDGSGMVRGERGEARELTGVGDTFGMSMRAGVPYRITNTVEEFDPLRLIAWRHAGRHRWRYELEPVEGGTRVTETFDWSRALAAPIYPLLVRLMGHEEAIPRTLERLRAVAVADAASS